MPTSPRKPTASRAKPATFTGSASINALIDQVAPAILGLLADGVPRTKGVVVQALAARHGARADPPERHRRGGADRQQVRAGRAGRGRAARGRLTRGVRRGACRPCWVPRAGRGLTAVQRPIALLGAPAARRGAFWRLTGRG